MKQSMTSAWKNSVAAASLAVMSLVPATAFSQASGPVAANTNKAKTETVTNKEPVVQIKDYREYSPATATKAAILNSQNGYIVVLVWGCDQKVIDVVEGSIKDLMWTGRTKIGMVISNMTERKTDEPQIAIMSKGDFATRIFNPSGTSKTEHEVNKAIREAYDRDIGKPKPVTASASLQPSPQEP